MANFEQNQIDCGPAHADQMTDIVWKVDPESMIVFSNRHWLQFAGLENDGTFSVQFPPQNYIHIDDMPKLQSFWEIAQSNLGEFSMEVRLCSAKHITYVWHMMRVWPLLESGELCSWLVVATDVHALKSTQAMFQLVMDNIPISIFWKDRNSHYLGCNQSFAADVGVTSSDALIGRNDYDNPSTREQSAFFIQCDKRVIDSGKAEYHIIETQLRPGGVQAWLDTNKIPLRDAGGSVFGVLGMYEDITKRILLEQQREDFVATLTHDLKNPLLGTNRILELFVKGKLGDLDANQMEILDQLKESNTSLLELIQNLLDVYKYDNLSRLPDYEEINLKEFLERVTESFQINARMRQIDLRLNISDQSHVITVNAQAIKRVLQNLIDNALKFVPAKGYVEVQVNKFAEHYSIEIRDNGPGVELEDQKYLFHRFWQGAPGKKFIQGTGLGLYLCKQIVEAHKGTISCQSIPGNGASFIVVLPINNLDAQM